MCFRSSNRIRITFDYSWLWTWDSATLLFVVAITVLSPWRQIPNRLSVFICRYSVFFGIPNTDVGNGIGISKYQMSVRYFGIPTQASYRLLHSRLQLANSGNALVLAALIAALTRLICSPAHWIINIYNSMSPTKFIQPILITTWKQLKKSR